MKNFSKLASALAVFGGACLPSAAAVTMIDASQVGGFYADGSADNDASFQNYFVGYGTSAGSTRTAERRSFFTFDLSGVTETVTSATFSLHLKAGGLIFGTDCLGADPCTGMLPAVDDPGTPWDDTDPGAWPKDTFEEFVLGATSFSSAEVTDTALPPDDPGPGIGKIDIFETFDDISVADPLTITDAEPLDFSGGPIEIVMELNELGITLLNDAIAAGGDFVLTGYMPSWSFEDRLNPAGDALVESSELIFGLTDVVGMGGVPGDTPSPFLELTTVAVPVPAAVVLFGSAFAGLFGLRRATAKR